MESIEVTPIIHGALRANEPFWLEIPLNFGSLLSTPGTNRHFKTHPIRADLLIVGASSRINGSTLIKLATSENVHLSNDYVSARSVFGEYSLEDYEGLDWACPLALPKEENLEVFLITQASGDSPSLNFKCILLTDYGLNR